MVYDSPCFLIKCKVSGIYTMVLKISYALDLPEQGEGMSDKGSSAWDIFKTTI